MTSGSLTSSGSKGGTDIAGLNAFLARRRRCVEMVLSAEESKQGASGLDSNGLEGDRGIGWMFSLFSMFLIISLRRWCLLIILIISNILIN